MSHYSGAKAKRMAEQMKLIGKSLEKWEIYYYDEKSETYWIMDYPESEFHGGGQPRLRKSTNPLKESKP